MINSITAGLTAKGQKFGTNRGKTRYAGGKTAWENLDDVANPPAVIMEESAWAYHGWGANDGQFFQPADWLSQTQTIDGIVNSDVVTLSSIDLSKGESGTDNWGKSFSYEDALWYAFGSYLLVKEDNVFFYFLGENGTGDYNEIDEIWQDEYDYINIGNPVGGYYAKAVDGINLYMRKYDLGYVIVNPQLTDLSNVNYATDLGLQGTFREITHANMTTDPWTDIEASTQFATFLSHRTKILYSGLVVYDVSPTDGGSGISITSSATWDHVDYVDDVEVWLDSGACDGTPDDAGADDLGDESSADADKTYDMSTLLENTAYCLTIVANAGAEQGEFQQFDFTTTTGPPAPPAGLATCSYHSLGLTGSYADQGATVGE